MFKKYPLTLLLFGFSLFPYAVLHAQETPATDNLSTTNESTNYRIRYGQGGFSDNRSPVGSLGGGEFTLDIMPANYPVIVSLSSEYYTNSPDPTNSYEISDLISLNILYTSSWFDSEKTDYFIGGGIGRLKIATSNETTSYNLEAVIHTMPYEKVGFYAMYKYLYATKETNNIEVIDFNEHIILLGITYSFTI